MKRSLPISLAVTGVLATVAVLSATNIAARQAASSYDRGAGQNGQDPRKRYAERLEPFLARTMRDDNIPGLAIGIVEDGQLVYSRGFGLIKVGEPDHPVTPQTLFHMASITKPFVATAVMQLVEQNRFDLDAPLTKYVPYFQLV